MHGARIKQKCLAATRGIDTAAFLNCSAKEKHATLKMRSAERGLSEMPMVHHINDFG